MNSTHDLSQPNPERNSQAKQAILHRLQRYQPVKPTKQAHSEKDGGDMTPAAKSPADQEGFLAKLQAAHTEVISTTGANWQEALAQDLSDKQIDPLLYAPGHSNNRSLTGLAEKGLELVKFDIPIEEIKDRMFNQIQAGLSHAVAGISDTGTLVLATGPDEPRTLSLVPEVNYMTVRASRLFPDLQTAMQTTHFAQLPTNMLLISGPSKTADIQQTLAYGAHGPKRLVVLFIQDN